MKFPNLEVLVREEKKLEQAYLLIEIEAKERRRIAKLPLLEIYQEIGKWLWVWRENKHLTIEKVARLLEVSPSYYNDAENGKKNPKTIIKKIFEKNLIK